MAIFGRKRKFIVCKNATSSYFFEKKYALTFLEKSKQKTFIAVRCCVNLNVPAYFFGKK